MSMQLMSLLRDYDVEWPGSTIQLLSYSDSLNLGISITAPQCFVPGYNFFIFYIATMAQPVSSAPVNARVTTALLPATNAPCWQRFLRSCRCVLNPDGSVTASRCAVRSKSLVQSHPAQLLSPMRKGCPLECDCRALCQHS